MQMKNDGGAAFPCVSADGRDENQGMALRDYFAGQALITAMNGKLWTFGSCEDVAKLAYQIADAMLAARLQG